MQLSPLALTILLASFACASNVSAQEESPQHWYELGQAELKRSLERKVNTGQAKNIILFIGDGMGISTITAARILDGQQRGEPGEENSLAFERLPAIALSRTYNTNQQTADSAGTMSAIMSGIKTKAGFIGVNAGGARGDCAAALKNAMPTFLEQAEDAGLATGIVTTTRITHATPAATYAHVPERDWESDANLPPEAKSRGCRDIARQLIEFDHGNGIEVALGGGSANFLPVDKGGTRQDGRDLTQEWQARFENGRYVSDREQLLAINSSKTERLFGLFSPSHMSYYQDRQTATAAEPNLPEMTRKAIEILQQQSGGFFLMVEGGRIDHAHHAGNAQRALQDTRELSEAVQVAMDLTRDADTLIIVTADHSHTLTIGGYPTRGNPILGTVVTNDTQGEAAAQAALAQDGMPYTTLGYRNGRGFAVGVGGDKRYREVIAAGRHDLKEVDTEHPDYHQQVLVPLVQESHAAEDVAIYSGGPWSHLFQRSHEQHYIYHVMRHAAQLDKRSGK